MGRHTIGDKRGSVRGAPPDVYLGFASCDSGNEHELAAAFRPILLFFKHLFTGAGLFLLVMAFCIIWVAFKEPDP